MFNKQITSIHSSRVNMRNSYSANKSSRSSKDPVDIRKDDILRQNAKDWKYSQRDRNTANGWAKLLLNIKNKSTKLGIGYLYNDAKVAAIKQKPVEPEDELYEQLYDANGDEIPESKKLNEERINRNKKAYDQWGKLCDQRVKDLKKLEQDYEKAMNIINECVDNLIVHALDVELQKHTDVATNEELYKIMRKELESEHGPNTSLDTEILKQKLRTMDGDAISWRNYITEFKSGVNLLAHTPIRDKNGDVLRGPVPQPVLPSPPNIEERSSEFKRWGIQVLEIQERHAQQFKDGGPILTNAVPERELIEYVMRALGKSKLDSFIILHRTLERDYANIKDSSTVLKEIEAICKRATRESEIKLKRDRETDGPGDRKYKEPRRKEYNDGHYSRHDKDNFQPQTNNQYRIQTSDRCKNCDGKHATKACMDPKCYVCGEVLPTAADRSKHWVDKHSKTAAGGQSPSGRDGGTRNNSRSSSHSPDRRHGQKDRRSRSPHPSRGKQRSSRSSRDGASSAGGSSGMDSESEAASASTYESGYATTDF